MELAKFVEDFASEFEDSEFEDLGPMTNYHDLEEWDSLVGLSIIGMVRNKYGVRLTGEEVKNAGTVEALFNIVESKQQ